MDGGSRLVRFPNSLLGFIIDIILPDRGKGCYIAQKVMLMIVTFDTDEERSW